MWGEQPERPVGRAARPPRADAAILAELEWMLQAGGSAASLGGEARAEQPPRLAPAPCEVWEDGRPKGWPTLQLRIRAKPFDVYCEHPTDVTLDGVGIPVINGHTVSREDLARGWFSSR